MVSESSKTIEDIRTKHVPGQLSVEACNGQNFFQVDFKTLVVMF